MKTDKFIQIWRQSKTMAEVAEKTGYTQRSASTIAWRLRSLGHDLDNKYDSKARAIAGRKGGMSVR